MEEKKEEMKVEEKVDDVLTMLEGVSVEVDDEG